MDFLLLLFALLGHAFFWIGLVNRLHALGFRRRIINVATLTCFLLAAVMPFGIVVWLYMKSPHGCAIVPWRLAAREFGQNGLVKAYAVGCWTVAAATLLRLVWLRWALRTPPLVRFHGRRRAKIDARAAEYSTAETAHHFITRLPLNEILRLDVTDWTLDVPRLAPALDGLSIVHLSDLHFTGRVGKAFFREVVRTSNELQPDLVALTGDLFESAEFLDWIPDTLGRLTARYGVYFILGNHDRRTHDLPRLRRTLDQSGLIDMGGRRRQIEINGHPVLLLGNELPWTNSEGDVESDMCGTHPPAACGFAPSAPPLRIVLAHTPDQLAWARAQDADLMLAGHTHGGQICIPPLGAIFSPSLWGVKHISGIYYSPPTILHVTRGVSGDTPIRWNCPPEVARIKLVRRH
jgi:predicted MPP superfamily phosphohydrolase